VRDLNSEIADLKNTITGLKGSLNLSRSETRALMNENATLRMKLLNTNSDGHGEGKSNNGHYSDVSDQENEEGSYQ
jgi:regulator of replication initiation timing